MLALLGAALFVAACGKSGDAGADPATVLPANVPVYVQATVRPEGGQKESVEQFLGKVLPGQKDPGTRLEDLLNRSLEEDGQSYKEDIEPWLGERAGIFFLNFEGEDPDGAAVLAAKDTDKAEDFVKSEEGVKEASYKDVTYYRDSDGDASGVVGDFVVVGSEAGFKAVVDAEQGDNQLADSDKFTNAVDEAGGEDSLGLAYADPRSLLRVLEQSGAGQAQALRSIPTLRGNQPLVATVNAQSDALEVATSTPVRAAREAGQDPGAAPDLTGLPGDSWLAFGSADIGKQARTQIEAAAGAQAALLDRQLQQQADLSLDDIVSWMGDLTAYVKGTSISDLGVGIEIESTDPDASEEAVTKLGRLAEEQASTGSTEVRAGDGEITITDPELPEPIEIKAEGDKVTATFGTGGGGGDLGSSPAFTQAAQKLEGQKPSFFLSFPQVIELAESSGAGSAPQFGEAKPYLDALNYLIAGSKLDGDRVDSSLVLGVK